MVNYCPPPPALPLAVEGAAKLVMNTIITGAGRADLLKALNKIDTASSTVFPVEQVMLRPARQGVQEGGAAGPALTSGLRPGSVAVPAFEPRLALAACTPAVRPHAP